MTITRISAAKPKTSPLTSLAPTRPGKHQLVQRLLALYNGEPPRPGYPHEAIYLAKYSRAEQKAHILRLATHD